MVSRIWPNSSAVKRLVLLTCAGSIPACGYFFCIHSLTARNPCGPGAASARTPSTIFRLRTDSARTQLGLRALLMRGSGPSWPPASPRGLTQTLYRLHAIPRGLARNTWGSVKTSKGSLRGKEKSEMTRNLPSLSTSPRGEVQKLNLEPRTLGL